MDTKASYSKNGIETDGDVPFGVPSLVGQVDVGACEEHQKGLGS